MALAAVKLARSPEYLPAARDLLENALEEDKKAKIQAAKDAVTGTDAPKAAPPSNTPDSVRIEKDAEQTAAMLMREHEPLDDSQKYQVASAGPVPAGPAAQAAPDAGNDLQSMPETVPVEDGRSARHGTMGQQSRPRQEIPQHRLQAAFTHGLQGSVPGLAARGKNADALTPEQLKNLPASERFALSLGQIVGDMPAYGAFGAVSSVGGPTAAVAGAIGLTEALRSSYLQALEKGEITSFGDFLQRSGIAAFEGGKGAAIGMAGGISGKIGANMMGPAGAALGEVVGMTQMMAAMEGRFPSLEDFTHNAALILAVRGGTTAAKGAVDAMAGRLKNIFAETGLKPDVVAKLAKEDPSVLRDMQEGKAIPERIKQDGAKQNQQYLLARNAAAKGEGSFTSEAGAQKPSSSEQRAGEGFAKLGYDVVRRQAANDRGMHNERTSDFIVEPFGHVEVYEPTSKSIRIIKDEVFDKNPARPCVPSAGRLGAGIRRAASRTLGKGRIPLLVRQQFSCRRRTQGTLLCIRVNTNSARDNACH